MYSKKTNNGFTLVEIILASIILSMAALALGAISTRSLSQARLSRQYDVAMACVNRQLTMIDYIGIKDFIEMGNMEGEFEGLEPVYRWKVATGSMGIDNLYLVNITVSWTERGRLYSVSVDTRLNGTGTPLIEP